MANKSIKNISWIFVGFTVGVIVTLFFLGIAQMGKATIIVNGHELEVYVADSVAEHAQGLSNIALDEFDADGMYFEFDDQAQRTFWMKDMQFAIDIIWMHDGLIVKTEENIPPPIDGNTSYMYSDPFEVNAALELPAGGVDMYGIEVNTFLAIFN